MHFLNPTIFDLPAYVRDTTDFLRKISALKDLPPNTLLVILDVESLYTNIPNDYGIAAAKHTLAKTRALPSIKPSNASLITLLRLVLTKNNFKFNGEQFLHVGGCTMGSKLSVGYANNSLGKFENEHVYTRQVKPFLYLRYIDDIFIISLSYGQKVKKHSMSLYSTSIPVLLSSTSRKMCPPPQSCS